LQNAGSEVWLPRCETLKVPQAFTSITSLKRREHVPRINGCHHPESAFAFDFQHIRSADQMAVAEPPILVFAFVAKNYTYASARPDGDSTEVGGDWLLKSLLLSFNDSQKFEICMALYVKTYLNRVRHNCVPLTAYMARLGVRHGIIQADAVPKT
jgi:hypothetical protein